MNFQDLRTTISTLQPDDRVSITGTILDSTGTATFKMAVWRKPLHGSGSRLHACRWCLEPFTGRVDAKYCSGRCRTAAGRASKTAKIL